MSIAARYSGTCPECGGRWSPGDLIRTDQGVSVTTPARWQHALCPDDPADPSLRPGESACQRCWLVHPEGSCDR